MKSLKRVLAMILIATFVLAVPTTVLAVDTKDPDDMTPNEYIDYLIASGFPDDYAHLLSMVHRIRPNWTFEPLDVTGLSGGKYTWDYVVKQETGDPKRSLVANSDQYVVLRDYLDANQYDSGWWKASVPAVEFMLDPRNFINEYEIFQFMDLSWSDSVTVDTVEATLKGTFMSHAKLDDIYSDLTYAEYFMKIGKELGASPVYLASRVRNEQGVNGTSPLISGACGDKLWYYYSNKITGSENGKLIKAPASGYDEAGLKQYNGLYNYFNIGASGTGYFSIYLGGMNEAQKGTPSKAAEWGGSPAWNTRWKALYGGAYTATERYIKDYQNTSYLQKFNVDPRSSRNFWGQYMQSIHGSYSAGQNIYNSFKDNGMLDLPYHFQIPVYSGMPEACPYPDGTEFANTSKLTASTVGRYDMIELAGRLGVQKGYTSEKITWRVFLGEKGKVLDLGVLDLTQYSQAIIEYSVASNFDSLAGGTRDVIGFVGERERPYVDADGNLDLGADLGHTNMADGKNGYLYRRYATVNLSDVDYYGHVFLTAFTVNKQKYLVHNVVFITGKNYDSSAATTPAFLTEADPADTDYVPADAGTGEENEITDADTTGAGNTGNGCGSVVITAFVPMMFPVCLIMKKKKKRD